MADEIGAALSVPAGVLADAAKVLVAALPYEACGWLARGPSGWRVVPIRNALRHADPAAARRRFVMAPEDLIRAVRGADARDEDLVAMFHGHPEGEADISPSDAAAWAPGGYPLYPTAILLIGAVYRDGCRQWRAYQWRHGQPCRVPVVVT